MPSLVADGNLHRLVWTARGETLKVVSCLGFSLLEVYSASCSPWCEHPCFLCLLVPVRWTSPDTLPLQWCPVLATDPQTESQGFLDGSLQDHDQDQPFCYILLGTFAAITTMTHAHCWRLTGTLRFHTWRRWTFARILEGPHLEKLICKLHSMGVGN